MALYGVKVSNKNGGTDFYALCAAGQDEATELAIAEFGIDVDFEISNLESLIDEQYDGLAVLSTDTF